MKNKTEDKIVIDKESVKEFDKVTIYFIKSYYTLDIGVITDMHFDVTVEKRTEDLEVTDGFIELAPKAVDVLGLLVDDYYPEEDRITEPLFSRLEAGTDITRLCFTSRKKEMTVYLPCNPLTDCDANVVECSDCPSVDVLPDGSLRIYAGKSSKNPSRENLICSDVCKNWNDIMGKKYRPDILNVRMNQLKIERNEIAIEVEICNPQSPVFFAEFVFNHYKIHSFNMYLGQGYFSADIEVARMDNGDFYVCLQECGICLECKEISVFNSI